MKQNSSTVKEFCDSHTENLKVFTTDVIQSIQTNREIIDRTTASNEELSNKFKSLLDQMNELLIQSKSNTETISKVSPEWKLVESHVRDHANQNIEAVNGFNAQYDDEISSLTATLNECDRTVKTIDGSAKEIVRINKEKDSKLIGRLHTMESDLTKQNNELSTQLDVMINDIHGINETTVISIDAGLNVLIDTVNTEQERIEQCAMETTEIHTNLESTQKDYAEKLLSDVHVCMTRLDSFQKDEIKMYTPTGQTPSKRDYQYTKVLAATSPHAKIIHEFWNNHDGSVLDCSAVIAEVAKHYIR